MPLGQAADGAIEGAAFGLFPIVWIILNAVWISKLQRSSSLSACRIIRLAGIRTNFPADSGSGLHRPARC